MFFSTKLRSSANHKKLNKRSLTHFYQPSSIPQSQISSQHQLPTAKNLKVKSLAHTNAPSSAKQTVEGQKSSNKAVRGPPQQRLSLRQITQTREQGTQPTGPPTLKDSYTCMQQQIPAENASVGSQLSPIPNMIDFEGESQENQKTTLMVTENEASKPVKNIQQAPAQGATEQPKKEGQPLALPNNKDLEEFENGKDGYLNGMDENSSKPGESPSQFSPHYDHNQSSQIEKEGETRKKFDLAQLQNRNNRNGVIGSTKNLLSDPNIQTFQSTTQLQTQRILNPTEGPTSQTVQCHSQEKQSQPSQPSQKKQGLNDSDKGPLNNSVASQKSLNLQRSQHQYSAKHEESSIVNLEASQQEGFYNKLLSVIDEPSAVRKQRIMTKGGICRQARCISHDIRQYQGALRGLRNALDKIERQHHEQSPEQIIHTKEYAPVMATKKLGTSSIISSKYMLETMSNSKSNKNKQSHGLILSNSQILSSQNEIGYHSRSGMISYNDKGSPTSPRGVKGATLVKRSEVISGGVQSIQPSVEDTSSPQKREGEFEMVPSIIGQKRYLNLEKPLSLLQRQEIIGKVQNGLNLHVKKRNDASIRNSSNNHPHRRQSNDESGLSETGGYQYLIGPSKIAEQVDSPLDKAKTPQSETYTLRGKSFNQQNLSRPVMKEEAKADTKDSNLPTQNSELRDHRQNSKLMRSTANFAKDDTTQSREVARGSLENVGGTDEAKKSEKSKDKAAPPGQKQHPFSIFVEQPAGGHPQDTLASSHPLILNLETRQLDGEGTIVTEKRKSLYSQESAKRPLPKGAVTAIETTREAYSMFSTGRIHQMEMQKFKMNRQPYFGRKMTLGSNPLSKIKLQLNLNDQLVSLISNGFTKDTFKEDPQASKLGQKPNLSKFGHNRASAPYEPADTKRSSLWTKRSKHNTSPFALSKTFPSRPAQSEDKQMRTKQKKIEKKKKEEENLQMLKHQIQFQHPSQLNLMIYNTVTSEQSLMQEPGQYHQGQDEEDLVTVQHPMLHIIPNTATSQQLLSMYNNPEVVSTSGPLTTYRGKFTVMDDMNHLHSIDTGSEEKQYFTRQNFYDQQKNHRLEQEKAENKMQFTKQDFLPSQVFRKTLQSRGMRHFKRAVAGLSSSKKLSESEMMLTSRRISGADLGDMSGRADRSNHHKKHIHINRQEFEITDEEEVVYSRANRGTFSNDLKITQSKKDGLTLQLKDLNAKSTVKTEKKQDTEFQSLKVDEATSVLKERAPTSGRGGEVSIATEERGKSLNSQNQTIIGKQNSALMGSTRNAQTKRTTPQKLPVTSSGDSGTKPELYRTFNVGNKTSAEQTLEQKKSEETSQAPMPPPPGLDNIKKPISIQNIEEEVTNLNIGTQQIGTELSRPEFTSQSLQKGGGSLQPHKQLAKSSKNWKKDDFVVIEQVSDRSAHQKLLFKDINTLKKYAAGKEAAPSTSHFNKRILNLIQNKKIVSKASSQSYLRKSKQVDSQKQFFPGMTASTRLHFIPRGSQQAIQYPSGYMLQGRKSQQNEQFLKKTRRYFGGDQSAAQMRDQEQMTDASARDTEMVHQSGTSRIRSENAESLATLVVLNGQPIPTSQAVLHTMSNNDSFKLRKPRLSSHNIDSHYVAIPSQPKMLPKGSNLSKHNHPAAGREVRKKSSLARHSVKESQISQKTHETPLLSNDFSKGSPMHTQLMDKTSNANNKSQTSITSQNLQSHLASGKTSHRLGGGLGFEPHRGSHQQNIQSGSEALKHLQNAQSEHNIPGGFNLSRGLQSSKHIVDNIDENRLGLIEQVVPHNPHNSTQQLTEVEGRVKSLAHQHKRSRLNDQLKPKQTSLFFYSG